MGADAGSASTPLYPPLGLYYTAQLSGDGAATDCQFKELSGLSVEMGVAEIKEGGENRFKHRVPEGAKYTNLVLKRGLVLTSQPFYQWCAQTLQGNLAQPIQPQSVLITLMNEQGTTLMTWNVVNAWPVKWSASDFNSMEGQVVLETLELAYQYFEVSSS